MWATLRNDISSLLQSTSRPEDPILTAFRRVDWDPTRQFMVGYTYSFTSDMLH